jgi:hypothetical protein
MLRGIHLSILILSLPGGACVDLERPGELGQTADAAQTAGSPGNPGADGPSSAPDEPTPPSVEAGASDASELADSAAGAPDTSDSSVDLVMDAPIGGSDAGDGSVASPDAQSPDASASQAPTDAGADALRAMIVDDFSDGNLSRNALGAEVITENQTVSMVSGEVSFVWSGRVNSSHAFAQNLSLEGCPVDLRPYRSVRFRMRASAPGKEVFIVLGRADAACMEASTVDIGSVTLATVTGTYEVELTRIARDNARFLQWVADPDLTRYFLDDITLVP